MMFETVAQQIVFTALNGEISAAVYDDVPSLPSGQPSANFPYVVIGNDTFRAWDTDDTLGAEITLTLHIWSRAAGFKEAKAIMGEIYAILHRAQITKDDYSVTDCLCEFSDTMDDPDGKTKHGVVRYRLTIQATEPNVPPIISVPDLEDW